MSVSESWQDVVWQAKPELARLQKDHGNVSVAEYFKASAAPGSSGIARAVMLLETIRQEVQRLFGPEIATRAVETLTEQWMVSTADHHGPLCHPFFLNANLVQALVNREKGLSAVLVLACGGISLNNSSFPRGLFVYDRSGKEARLLFASLKHRRHPVIGFPPYRPADIARAERSLEQRFDKDDTEVLREMIRTSFGADPIFDLSSYSDQASWGNYRLWKKLPGEEDTDLISLEQEAIVAKLLLKHHLSGGTTVYQLLFDRQWREAFLRLFDGIPGAFSAAGKGSVFFWRLQAEHRIPLVFREGYLAASGEDWRVALEPAAIRDALEKKEIFSSMALTFIVLAFHYGLQCGGGFSQINYLGAMREAWLALLEEVGAPEAEKDIARNVKTNTFRGDFVLAAMSAPGRTVAATSVDLILRGTPKTAALLRKMASELSMREAIATMMPEYHKIITGRYPTATTPFFPQPSLF